MRYLKVLKNIYYIPFLFLSTSQIQAQSEGVNWNIPNAFSHKMPMYGLKSSNSSNFQKHDVMPSKSSEARLLCYYRNKSSGESSWKVAIDSQNNEVIIRGEWTDSSNRAMLKVAQNVKDFEQIYIPLCVQTNTDPSKEYAEYGALDNQSSYKHKIWFEQLSSNDYSLPFSRLVIFGDSLSDTGNLFNYTNHIYVAGSYYMGRFTNGLVWPEYISKELSLDLYDWAVGGATTSTPLPPVTDTLDSQIDSYLEFMTQVQSPAYDQTIYGILSGANNYLFNVDPEPVNVVSNIALYVEKLISAGGRNFIISNLPDISHTPELIADGPEAQIEMENKIKLHNRLLAEALSNLKNKYPAINIIEADSFTFLNNIVENPSQYKFSNVTEKCNLGLPAGPFSPQKICDNPKSYLWWDFIHPTTKVHCQMAQDIMEKLSNSYQGIDFHKDYEKCDISFVNK